MADYSNDTIAAISTAMSPSGIGIVRMSGEDVFEIADRIYSGKKGKKLSDQKGYTIHYGHIVDNGRVVDEVLVMIMRAPHSYTGENTVEIDCHGGILATRKVLEAAVHAGARPAEPGEFSKRAFLNGRMDLSQAEAVMNVISAKNDFALNAAEKQLGGAVSSKIRDIRNRLLHETAHIEAALDDPEHMSIDEYKNEIRNTVLSCRDDIKKLIESSDTGILMTEGIKTVIIGKPNAGKSTLLNLLSGEEKAIVTDIPGTTRDILEEHINIGGITLRLIDTAGIRETSDVIEKIGVDRAKQNLKEADLILYVADGSVPFDENDEEIIRLLKNKKAIIILNKSDLVNQVNEAEIRHILSVNGIHETIPVIPMSAKLKTGSDLLIRQIEDLFFNGEIDFNDQVYITETRHKDALQEAVHSLNFVLKSMDEQMPEDFWSIDLMGACDALGKITGESTGEDLVNEIFSSFCMGK